MSIVGVTSCPDCDSELKPTDSTDGRPVQHLTQSCSECDFETTIALLWYPQEYYEIVADVSSVEDEQKQSCRKSEQEADVVVVPPESEQPQYYSIDHTRAHHREALNALSD